jgi:hypothetical protein
MMISFFLALATLMASGSEKSDDERDSHGRFRGSNLQDPGWLHGIPLSQDKKKTQCSYCGKKMASGGISRLKQHLVGGYSNVAKCPVVPEIVREQMRELIKDGRGKRAERTIREERMREALYDETMGGDEAVESDSDFEYPSEYTTTAERRAYKEAVMRSRKDQWERE